MKIFLTQRFLVLKESMGQVLVSINQEYAFDNAIIPNNAEIALFPGFWRLIWPPTIYSIIEDEIDIGALLAQITLTSAGAAAIFAGMVRGITRRDDPQETAYLEYESCKPMAEEK